MSAAPERALEAQWQETCRQTVVSLQIPLTAPKLRLSRRMTWRLGSYRQDRHEVALSYWLAAHHPQEALETLKHELAHALAFQRSPRCRPHGPEWREACRLLGVAPRRCSELPRLGPPARPRQAYLYQCQTCGHQAVYRRRLRLPHSCGRCDRRYNPRHRLRLVAQLPPPGSVGNDDGQAQPARR